LKESQQIVFGDSFAFGSGVDDKHLFANLVNGLSVKPVAIFGYDLVQEVLWMRQLLPALKGKQVVWFIYLANDIHDNLSPDLYGCRRPFVRQIRAAGGWEIVSSHVCDKPWSIDTRSRLGTSYDAAHLAELSSATWFAKRAFSACEFLIQQGKHACDAADASLVVMTIPDKNQLTPYGRQWLKSLSSAPETFNADAPDERIEAICRKLGLDFVSGKSFLDPSCYKANDLHWNEVGHRKVAEMLTFLYSSGGSAKNVGRGKRGRAA
jgi:hypothetical protein